MKCAQCGRDIEADSSCCRHCGSASDPGGPRRLRRRSSSGRIAGVCAGIAEYFGTDVTLVRLLWVILSVVPGGVIGGVVAYVAAWIVMPDAAGAAAPEGHRLTRSPIDRKIAGVCGGLAAYLKVDPTVVRLAWVVLTIVPGAIVLGVAAYLVAWFIMPMPGANPMTPTPSAA